MNIYDYKKINNEYQQKIIIKIAYLKNFIKFCQTRVENCLSLLLFAYHLYYIKF